MGCVPRDQPLFRKERSFDSVLQSRQHTVCPDFRFHPIPSCADVSRLFSRCRHCREFFFRSSVQSVFHLPASLGSTPITALPRYYGRCDSSARSRPDRGLPDSCTWPSCHSVSNHLCRPNVALSRYPSARWTSSLQRSGLRLRLAGSPQTPAESSLSSYGLAVHSL
jgi:hypothetical protein